MVTDNELQRTLQSETHLENLMNQWPGIVFRQRPDFSFVFISPKIEELTGVPASKFEQPKCFWDIVHEADAEALAVRLRSEQESSAGMTTTYRIRHAETGRVTHVWEHRRAIRTENGMAAGFEGIWLDITRQINSEQRLVNMSGRENLGILTMGLAHDFCNVMTGIVGLSETFEASAEVGSALRNGLGLIRETAMKASSLAHRLRQLHQGIPGEKSYQDLNECVRSLIDLLEKALPRRVRVLADLAPGQLPLYVDAVQLQQVIINLAINAADAMAKGGEVTFRTRRQEELPTIKNFQGIRPRAPVIGLSVQDTGTGIPTRLLNSIFDPFFTTKPMGKGSGLGLYNARLFVEKHGAAMAVETEEGRGSTFHLWFTEADFSEEQQGLPPARPKRHTLLVAGPAGERLDSIAGTLRGSGYYVVPTSGESGAFEALDSPAFEFSALIVLCTGRESEELSLCQRVRAHKLPLKIILTGAGNQGELTENALQCVDAIIPIGVSPQEFVSRVKQVLE